MGATKVDRKKKDASTRPDGGLTHGKERLPAPGPQHPLLYSPALRLFLIFGVFITASVYIGVCFTDEEKDTLYDVLPNAFFTSYASVLVMVSIALSAIVSHLGTIFILLTLLCFGETSIEVAGDAVAQPPDAVSAARQFLVGSATELRMHYGVVKGGEQEDDSADHHSWTRYRRAYSRHRLHVPISPADAESVLRWTSKPMATIFVALLAWRRGRVISAGSQMKTGASDEVYEKIVVATYRSQRFWLKLAIILALLGDMALLAKGMALFLIGLSCFLLGHLAFIKSFTAQISFLREALPLPCFPSLYRFTGTPQKGVAPEDVATHGFIRRSFLSLRHYFFPLILCVAATYATFFGLLRYPPMVRVVLLPACFGYMLIISIFVGTAGNWWHRASDAADGIIVGFIEQDESEEGDDGRLKQYAEHAHIRLLASTLPQARFAYIGSLFFIVSDAQLAVDRFGFPIPYSSFTVLATYWIAMLLLAHTLPERVYLPARSHK